jgi:hypothetical protein
MFALLPPSRSRCDHRAGAGAAGETDHVDAGMRDQRLASLPAAAVHQVHDAGRQPGVVQDLDHAPDGEWHVLGRLEHARVAPRYACSDARRGQGERGVPWRNERGDALRLASHVRDEPFGLRIGFPTHGARDFREELEVARGSVDVPLDALQRQAAAEALQESKLFGMRAQAIPNRVEHVLALVDVHARPGAVIEGPARGEHRSVHLAGVRLGERAQRLLGGRTHDRQLRCLRARHGSALDEAADARGHGEATGDGDCTHGVKLSKRLVRAQSSCEHDDLTEAPEWTSTPFSTLTGQ